MSFPSPPQKGTVLCGILLGIPPGSLAFRAGSRRKTVSQGVVAPPRSLASILAYFPRFRQGLGNNALRRCENSQKGTGNFIRFSVESRCKALVFLL
jgi:hypothetical protein